MPTSLARIRAAARIFAKARPAQLEWGCAIEHTPNTIQTVRAIALLPALTGNIDVPGGWVFGMKGLGRFPSLIENLTPEMNAKRLGADRFKMLSGEGADLPAAHIPTLLSAMRDGVPYPVKAFLVFGNNTLTTFGNAKEAHEALMKLDLLVVADLFMTPTCELADIVLPAASWPELDQLAALGVGFRRVFPTYEDRARWPFGRQIWKRFVFDLPLLVGLQLRHFVGLAARATRLRPGRQAGDESSNGPRHGMQRDDTPHTHTPSRRSKKV